MKCLICKENIQDGHCCMRINIGGKYCSIHMGCEHELTKLRLYVLNTLVDWSGIWHTYGNLLAALEEGYSITPTKKEVREALQFLVKIGEVLYGPLIDADYVPCGAGYTWAHGAGIC